MAGVKLVHVYGYVSCAKDDDARWAPWGCGKTVINAVITDSSNDVVLPPSKFVSNSKAGAYSVPGFHSQSPELELKMLLDPKLVSQGQWLRLWYGEDLKNYTEHDNDGTACADVYILYV